MSPVPALPVQAYHSRLVQENSKILSVWEELKSFPNFFSCCCSFCKSALVHRVMSKPLISIVLFQML